jgi:hypothetical protein
VVVTAGGVASNGVSFTVTVAPTISFVQATATAASGTASSLSLSFPANTLAGDLLLVAFDYNTSATASVTDSQGNLFTPVGNQLTSPAGAQSRVYYAQNIKGGADTVTVTLSANSSWLELYLTEYTGINPSIDAQAGASGSAGPVSSGNATTTVAGDMIFGYCIGDDVCTAGSGFIARSTLNGNLIEDMLAGQAGSYAATGSANKGWTMQMVALKPASGVVGTISSLSPTSGAVGTAVTITGTNFGSSQGTSTVTFNGVAATATSWSATSIATTVPSGATTGNVVVTVGGVASNGVRFRVKAR